jgi:hypothetical protein
VADRVVSEVSPVVQKSQHDESLLARVAFHPLLFAAYPVLLLYSDNVADVGPEELVPLLLVVVVVTLLIYTVLARATHNPRRVAIMVSAAVIPALLFGMVRDSFTDADVIDSLRGTLLAVAVSVASLSLAYFVASKHRWISQVTQALNMTSTVLVLLAMIPLGTFAATSWTVATTAGDVPSGADVVLDPPTGPQRDIYHLIFDRYGSETSLQVGPGIDNHEFISWLKDEGFHVIDGSRANYQKTLQSLAATLSVESLDELAQGMGPDNMNTGPLIDRIRNSRAGALLQSIGYRYVHLGSWFAKTRGSDIADSVRHPNVQASFLDAFLSRSILSLAWKNITDGTQMIRESTDYQFDELHAIVSEPGPTYVFAHILLPHPPFMFLADGNLDPGRATYESQLRYTNSRIQELVESLLDVPEPERPIIILQADEGPFPARYAADHTEFDWSAASDEELLMKFGILNAMYLPGPEGVAPVRPDLTAVNTYPELLRRYFGSTIQDLADRSYAFRNDKPYDYFDITERLADAESGLDVERR